MKHIILSGGPDAGMEFDVNDNISEMKINLPSSRASGKKKYKVEYNLYKQKGKSNIFVYAGKKSFWTTSIDYSNDDS